MVCCVAGCVLIYVMFDVVLYSVHNYVFLISVFDRNAALSYHPAGCADHCQSP